MAESRATQNEKPSIVEWFGDHEGYRCGYCNSQDTNYSHGMWAHTMTAQDYQDLLNRGWRRSGKYVYKPVMNQTCCPQYPIVCDVENFKLNKSHKKIIKTMNRYLIQGEKSPADAQWTCIGSPSSSVEDTTYAIKPAESGTGTSKKPDRKPPKPGDGADPDKPQCMKAKDRRLLKKMEKVSSQSKIDGTEGVVAGTSTSSFAHLFKKKAVQEKTLEQFLDEPEMVSSVKHRLEIRQVQSCPRSKEFDRRFKESHALYTKYQMSTHDDPPDKNSVKQFSRFLVDSPLQVRLVRTTPRSKDYTMLEDESYKIYRAYQLSVHHEDASTITERSYGQFLVDSPIQPQLGDTHDMPGLGSYHTHYILDGKLIAVGVLDILPTSISSVYLFYDPEYSFLSLGTYTALREISYARKLQKANSKIRFYNMGFYIHSCPKMKYKGQFRPAFLICPETYRWIPIEDCLPLLENNPYSRLCRDKNIGDADRNVKDEELSVLHNHEVLPLSQFTALQPGAIESVDEARVYAKLVGKKCCKNMLLYRS